MMMAWNSILGVTWWHLHHSIAFSNFIDINLHYSAGTFLFCCYCCWLFYLNEIYLFGQLKIPIQHIARIKFQLKAYRDVKCGNKKLRSIISRWLNIWSTFNKMYQFLHSHRSTWFLSTCLPFLPHSWPIF